MKENNTVHITKANFLRLLNPASKSIFTINKVFDERLIGILSSYQFNSINWLKCFLENPDYFAGFIEGVSSKDDFTLLITPTSPKFHKSECELRFNEYWNYYIPPLISKNEKVVSFCRDVFKKLKNLESMIIYLKDNVEWSNHLKEMGIDSSMIDANSFQRIEIENSLKSVKDVSFQNINDEIEKLVSLKHITESIKQRLYHSIIEHIILTQNPNLTFNATLLENLGFEPCSKCIEQIVNEKPTLKIINYPSFSFQFDNGEILEPSCPFEFSPALKSFKVLSYIGELDFENFPNNALTTAKVGLQKSGLYYIKHKYTTLLQVALRYNEPKLFSIHRLPVNSLGKAEFYSRVHVYLVLPNDIYKEFISQSKDYVFIGVGDKYKLNLNKIL